MYGKDCREFLQGMKGRQSKWFAIEMLLRCSGMSTIGRFPLIDASLFS